MTTIGDNHILNLLSGVDNNNKQLKSEHTVSDR